MEDVDRSGRAAGLFLYIHGETSFLVSGISLFSSLNQIAVHLLLRNWSLTLLFFFGLPVGFLFTLIVSEVAFESGLRLYPLCLSVLRRGQITEARRILSRDIQDLINELGPQVLPDFERIRVVKKGELDGVTWSLDESELLAELFE